MKLDPRHLIQLSVIVEERSFGRAAEVLGLSQPAISRNIRILEERLGCPVLFRTRGDIRPTRIGRKLADHGKVVHVQSLVADSFAGGVAAGAIGEVRIGAPPLLAEYSLPKPLLAFSNDRPGIAFRLETGLVHNILEMLAQGHLDMVIGPVGAVDRSSGYAVQQILRHRIRLYGRRGHPISRGPITKEKLAEARWAVLRHDSLIRSQMEAVLGSMGIQQITVGFECRTEGIVLNLIESSDMLTMLPGRSRADWMLERNIEEFPLEHDQLELPIGIVHRQADPFSDICRSLHEHLVDWFAALPS